MEKQIGVVLLPDEATDGFVRGLSWSLANNRLLLGLRDGSAQLPPHPHISLLHLVVREEMMRDFATTLFELAPRSLPQQTATEIHVNTGGWCFLETPRTMSLLGMQSAVIRASNGFRCRQVPISWKAHFTQAQEKAYRLYGYPNVRFAWDPHFTFGIVSPMPAAQRTPVRWNWTARSLAIVSLGHHGTAAEILVEHSLRTS